MKSYRLGFHTLAAWFAASLAAFGASFSANAAVPPKPVEMVRAYYSSPEGSEEMSAGIVAKNPAWTPGWVRKQFAQQQDKEIMFLADRFKALRCVARAEARYQCSGLTVGGLPVPAWFARGTDGKWVYTRD